MYFQYILLVIFFLESTCNGRTAFGCTSTDNNICTIDPTIHFPDGYMSHLDGGGDSADLVCDPAYPICDISCSDCDVANRRKSSYMRIYCPSLESIEGTPMGQCNVEMTGGFWSMKFGRIYGGDYNTLTLSYTSLATSANGYVTVYAPQSGGNLVFNRLSTEYPGHDPRVILYEDTNDVTLNCGESIFCVNSASFNAQNILGELSITAKTLSNINIYCPNNDLINQCNIECTESCSNLNVYTNGDINPFRINGAGVSMVY